MEKGVRNCKQVVLKKTGINYSKYESWNDTNWYSDDLILIFYANVSSCVTNIPNSLKLPLSTKRWILSQAVNSPFSCCFLFLQFFLHLTKNFSLSLTHLSTFPYS